MNSYGLGFFAHIFGALTLFIAVGVAHLSLIEMERAPTRELAQDHARVVLSNAILFIVGALWLLATGLHLAFAAWRWQSPWVLVPTVFLLGGGLVGVAILGVRLRRKVRELEELPLGPFAPDAAARRRDPIAAIVPATFGAGLVASVVVMVFKPDLVWSLVLVVGLPAATLVFYRNRLREAWHRKKRAKDVARMLAGSGGKPVLCDVLDAHVEGIETLSPFTLKAHRALKAAGIDYVTRRETQAGAYAHLNPREQIPVLVLGDGRLLAGSRAIVRMCAERDREHFEADLDPEVEADVHFWEEYAENVLKGFVAAARWADDRNWERSREAYFVGAPGWVKGLIAPRVRKATVRMLRQTDVWRGTPAEVWERYQQVLDFLEHEAPAQGFWLGTEKMTPADLSLFAFLQSLRVSLTPWHAEQVRQRAKLDAYLDRVDAATRGASAKTTSAIDEGSAARAQAS